jgi:predicted aspartyl protease
MKFTLTTFYICMLCIVHQKIYGQEEFIPPPAKKITSFNFTMLTGGIVIIHGTLNEFTDTLNFVLDTGSSGISLDSSTVSKFALKTKQTERTIRGIAGTKQVQFTYGHSLHLPGLTTDSLDFHINDYDLLTSVYGLKIDGIVGSSFLRRYIVRLDYDNYKIDIWKPGTFKYPKNGYMLYPGFNSLPTHAAIIKDATTVKSRFILDTGAGMCFLLNNEMVTDSSFFYKTKRTFPTQVEGLGGKKKMQLLVLKEVKIGPYKFKNVPGHVFEDDNNITNYPQGSGLIGNDMLRRFNVVINYPDKCIHLLPNQHFSDPFDYSYTGLGMYYENGEIKIVDIIEGSPAENAGLLPGDIIGGIETDFTGNIQAYKNLLMNAGNEVKLLIFRAGKPYIKLLKVQHIMQKKKN